MPLFHVGGICRNLLAPLFSGGATVAMPFFDVNDFWTVAVRTPHVVSFGVDDHNVVPNMDRLTKRPNDVW